VLPCPRRCLKVKCSAMSPELSPDARRRKEGLIERASGGTLFLDEIVQHVRQRASQNFCACWKKAASCAWAGPSHQGGRAHHRLLPTAEDVANEKFREDLYYRLNVVPLYIPPLPDS